MRISIGTKIFGGATILVAITACAAVASAYLTREVSRELKRIEATYIPLLGVVERIEEHTLEQEILFERLLNRPRASGHHLFHRERLRR